jgi:hypothetical protein
MSFNEKSNSNRWRFSKEITLGDLLLAVTVGLPLVIAAVRLSDRVEDHDRRLSASETAIAEHATRLSRQDSAIAVLQWQAELRPTKP